MNYLFALLFLEVCLNNCKKYENLDLDPDPNES